MPGPSMFPGGEADVHRLRESCCAIAGIGSRAEMSSCRSFDERGCSPLDQSVVRSELSVSPSGIPDRLSAAFLLVIDSNWQYEGGVSDVQGAGAA